MNAPLSRIRLVKLHLPTLTGESHQVELLETDRMTVLDAIKQVRGAMPPTWADGFACHAGACNTCSVVINGTPGVPCTTFIAALGGEVRVAPGAHAPGWDALRDDSRRVHG